MITMARPRKKANRQVKSKIYIYCEGKTTEPHYIRAYIQFKHPNCARLKKAEIPIEIKDTNKNTAIQLVNEAVAFMAQKDFDGDEVWVVYDRESPQKYADSLHQKAYNLADKKGVKVALSNVCFEYWLLLHLEETTPAMSDCDSLVSSAVFKNAFKEIGITRYDKKGSVSKDISKALMTDEYINNARERAQKINSQSKKASGFNCNQPYKIQPFTNIYELLAAIDRVAT